MERLEKRALEARSHHSAESVQRRNVEVCGRWAVAPFLARGSTPQQIGDPGACVSIEDLLASDRSQTFRKQFPLRVRETLRLGGSALLPVRQDLRKKDIWGSLSDQGSC